MRFARSGMAAGALFNFLRTALSNLTGVDEDRRRRRLKELSGIVDSAFRKIEAEWQPPPPPGGLVGLILPPLPDGVSLDDFWAYMLQHNYIFAPTGELWPGSSVDARVPPVPLLDEQGRPVISIEGEPLKISATKLGCDLPWGERPRVLTDQVVSVDGDAVAEGDRLIDDEGCFGERRPNADVRRPGRGHRFGPSVAERRDSARPANA
jgi:hypothetical protein